MYYRLAQIALGAVKWKAEGKLDLRGVRGEPGIPARFQSITVVAEIDTPVSQEELDKLLVQVTLHRMRACSVTKFLQECGVHSKMLCGWFLGCACPHVPLCGCVHLCGYVL